MSKKSKVTDLNVYPSYKGGDTLVAGGYICEYSPEHPLANVWGFVAQHRLIAEDMIGRSLVREGSSREKECVHHKNEDKFDNSPGNLQVLTMHAHRKLHAQEMNKVRELALNVDTVLPLLQKHNSVILAAKELGVHHQTLRNRFPDLVKPYIRSSPIDSLELKYQEQLVEVARYFAPTTISYAELAKLTKVCQKYWRKICQDNGIEWFQVRNAMTGRRLTYRGLPTRYAKELCASTTVSELRGH